MERHFDPLGTVMLKDHLRPAPLGRETENSNMETRLAVTRVKRLFGSAGVMQGCI